MKAKFFVHLLLFLLPVTTIMSQNYLVRVQKEGSKKWGYANHKGEMIIEAKYIFATNFSEAGTALIYAKGPILINKNGDIIDTEVEKLAPMREMWGMPEGYAIHGVKEGYFLTKNEGGWGALGPDGKIAVPFKYDRLTDFNSGFSLAERDNNFFVLKNDGTEFPIEAADVREIKHFSEGLGMIEVKGGLWGFVDGNGKIAIEPQFNLLGYFSGGLALARSKNGLIGYIDKQGDWVIEPQFNNAKEFDKESGMAVVSIGNDWGYVDTKGNTHIFEETSKTFNFSNGLAIGKKKGKIGYLNNKGKWAIEPQFDAGHRFNSGYAPAKLKGLWGIIDKKGNWVAEPAFKNIGKVVLVK